MSAKRGKFDFLADERQAEPERVDDAQASKSTNAQASKSTNAQASVERRPSGQRIRADLLRAYKIFAAESGKPQYVLIEEALEQYLTAQGRKV